MSIMAAMLLVLLVVEDIPSYTRPTTGNAVRQSLGNKMRFGWS
jgi:hypothetical protein